MTARKRQPLLIRPVLPDECEALSALAQASKAHWGYDDEFMENCRDELRVTPRKIARFRMRVAQAGREIAGFSAMRYHDDAADVEEFFVAPDYIGTGIGHRLMQDMLDHARRHGVHRVRVEADPNATGFYESEGFDICGETPSGSIPGRKLPLMERKI
ncbi:MAG: GNAT family N-acetyltransferase [Parvibaculum sp.]|uniref:GNAT family N-acetyltransferase n=1 Tax=Parvibaculum sp. TaxID=2024848 RepID=UPI002AB94703|nr:GNAT family N-acetyltransferase [Parvibaculum sp.]MDZ4380206.1 GNAT family N-acetyltransferase [Parvibaculum sp.]